MVKDTSVSTHILCVLTFLCGMVVCSTIHKNFSVYNVLIILLATVVFSIITLTKFSFLLKKVLAKFQQKT